MRESRHRPNVVSALRPNMRRLGNPRLRRRTFGALVLVATVAGATAALVSDRHVREWATAVAIVSLLTVMIAWLAGVSGSLSSSGRDPKDFDDP
jgi:hypothetical protein